MKKLNYGELVSSVWDSLMDFITSKVIVDQADNYTNKKPMTKEYDITFNLNIDHELFDYDCIQIKYSINVFDLRNIIIFHWYNLENEDNRDYASCIHIDFMNDIENNGFHETPSMVLDFASDNISDMVYDNRFAPKMVKDITEPNINNRVFELDDEYSIEEFNICKSDKNSYSSTVEFIDIDKIILENKKNNSNEELEILKRDVCIDDINDAMNEGAYAVLNYISLIDDDRLFKLSINIHTTTKISEDALYENNICLSCLEKNEDSTITGDIEVEKINYNKKEVKEDILINESTLEKYIQTSLLESKYISSENIDMEITVINE